MIDTDTPTIVEPDGDAGGRSPAPTGIAPLDHRIGGLSQGGSYLLVGTPGPAKMVAALQFLREGLARGERGALVTGADLAGILAVSEAWGLPLEDAWLEGRLIILGFREDFELRASRSVVPEEVLEELDREIGSGLDRIAVDPGALFLQGGTKTLLGGAYLRWARNHPATVCTTFSVDGDSEPLPASADWLLHATTGRLLVERRSGNVYQLSLEGAIPRTGEEAAPVTVELRPGAGLVKPAAFPTQRGRDRGAVDPRRLLLLLLGEESGGELVSWAGSAFDTQVVRTPMDAVTAAQQDEGFGAVLVSGPRSKVREALQACRVLRPLTRAALVFASDDPIRASDRIQLLEAGADDCLSGGLDFRELGMRVRQAIAAGSRTPAVDLVAAGTELLGGAMEPEAFRNELRRRSGDPALGVYSVVILDGRELDSGALRELAVQEVRSDEGDLVTTTDEEVWVLLQGARGSQARPFLDRLGARLQEGGKGVGLDPVVLSHPGDTHRISALWEETGGGAD